MSDRHIPQSSNLSGSGDESEEVVEIADAFSVSDEDALMDEALSLQSFDKQPSYTEVNPNEQTKLECIILNRKGDCLWQRNRKPISKTPGKYDFPVKNEPGDCSLTIKNAVAEYDDGEWECQVTASDFTTQDALTSQPVRLVVRAMPQEPRIENNGTLITPNQNVTVKTEDKAVLKCLSRHGNPPAILKWFLDDVELTPKGNQTNIPEEDNKRTFMAMSTLELYVNKSHHGKTIKCVAIHETYASKSAAVTVRLDITYPPEVRLEGIPNHDIEEGKDTVVLRCTADANPPATIIWQRQGSRDISSISETLIFRPVNQRDSGTYSCLGKNAIGPSQPISTTLDIKYAPLIKSVGPDKLTTSPLYSNTEFVCSADGNPPPTYQWLQRVPNPNGGPHETVIVRSSEPKLAFTNITYDYQGDYVCVVTNTISGTKRSIQSQPITLQVIGAPQVMRQSEKPEVVVRRGENALLSVVVCADPRPRRTAWEWGSSQLEAGAGIGRYHAEELLQDTKEDCYVARLHVKRVDILDARNYYLTVENERGLDKHSIYLAVRGSYTEPLGVSTVFTVAVGSLIVFMICILLAVYIIKSERCCFRRRRRGDFKPTDAENHHENDKSEISASNGYKPPKIEPMMDNGYNNEVMYCTSPTRRPPPPHITATGCSPDAMKKKRKTIYEGENAATVLTATRSEYVATGVGRVSTFRSDHVSLPGLGSVSRVEHSSGLSGVEPAAGSRYRKKGGCSSKRAKKRNTFAELQIPTVSDNGATRNRMASYNRQILVHSDLQSYSLSSEKEFAAEYFCPQQPQQQQQTQPPATKSYHNAYDYEEEEEELRTTIPRYGYHKKDVI